MSLDSLPVEILGNITSHFDSVESLAALSSTSTKLCNTLGNFTISRAGGRSQIGPASEAADLLYRQFVRDKFPTINVGNDSRMDGGPQHGSKDMRKPGFWHEAAKALTSRSRAWDRCGVTGRIIGVPDDLKLRERFWTDWRGNEKSHHRNRSSSNDFPAGFQTCIDSFETWGAGKDPYGWGDREEVLIFGAGSDIVLRKRQFGRAANVAGDYVQAADQRSRTSWAVCNMGGELATAYDDISRAYLLRPWQRFDQDVGHEKIVVARPNGGLSRISMSNTEGSFTECTYNIYGQEIRDCDISHGSNPIISAALRSNVVAFYPVFAPTTQIEPIGTLDLNLSPPAVALRQTSRLGFALMRSRFLSESKLALGLATRDGDPLLVYDISNAAAKGIRAFSFEDLSHNTATRVTAVSQIAPLQWNARTGGGPGDLFLVSWLDGLIRLHDIRAPSPSVAVYEDDVDSSKACSLLPFGHEVFFTGGDSDTMVKAFDFRNGKRPYTYRFAQESHGKKSYPTLTDKNSGSEDKDISIFLRVPQSTNTYSRSRGYILSSVHALSSPSPSSSTIYAGTKSTIASLDFACTEDLTKPSSKSWYENTLGIDTDIAPPADPADADPMETPLCLSAYERVIPKPKLIPKPPLPPNSVVNGVLVTRDHVSSPGADEVDARLWLWDGSDPLLFRGRDAYRDAPKLRMQNWHTRQRNVDVKSDVAGENRGTGRVWDKRWYIPTRDSDERGGRMEPQTRGGHGHHRPRGAHTGRGRGAHRGRGRGQRGSS